MSDLDKISSNRGLNFVTPANIMEMSHEKIMELAVSLSDDNTIPIRTRYRLVTEMYRIIGFDLSNDLLLALLVECKQQLILAIAGGCKTSTSQIGLIRSKIFWPYLYNRPLTNSECLCLVFTRENKPQMVVRHAELLAPLMKSGLVSRETSNKSYINSSINAYTLHSFGNKYLISNGDKIGLKSVKVASKDTKASMWRTAIRAFKKKHPDNIALVDQQKVELVYDIMHGHLMEPDDLTEDSEVLYDAISSSGLNPKELATIFSQYDASKKFMGVIDYTDQLLCFYRLLRECPEMCRKIHILYPYIIVDELQDFTPLMMAILKLMVGPDTKFLAIGDEDQSIYGFRGANIDNIMKFSDNFPDSRVFQLMINRRSGDNILSAANRIISLNTNRFPKKLLSTRGGGNIRSIPYSSDAEFISKMVHEISIMKSIEQRNTVICVREKVLGQPISKALFDKDIPFHTFNASRFDSHEVIRGFVEVMNLLWSPGRSNWKSLYKIVNIRKDDWFKYIGYDPAKRSPEPTNFPDATVFWKLKFEPFIHYSGMRETLNKLYLISTKINSRSCASYLEEVLHLFKVNFWATRMSMETVAFSEEAFDWIRSLFGKGMSYPSLHAQYVDLLSTLNGYKSSSAGVTLATFHSLKGLEYDNVYAAYMDDDIFPRFGLIDSKNYSQSVSCRLKESETRLAYVLVTRAKENLILYYNSQKPSYFMPLIDPNLNKVKFDTSKDGEQIIFSSKKEW